MILTEKDGDPVRKSLLLLLVLLLTAFCVCAAAETEYPLEAASGRMSFDENTFIVLTPGTLSEHPDLLHSLGKTADELRADMEARGVLFQAWSKDQKTCVEGILIQDELSAKYFDTEAQTRADRKQYMTDVISEAKQSGYAVFDPVIKNHGKSGNSNICSKATVQSTAATSVKLSGTATRCLWIIRPISVSRASQTKTGSATSSTPS